MSENSEINEQKTEDEDVLDEKYRETEEWPPDQEDDIEALKLVYELSKYHFQVRWELAARYSQKFGILVGVSSLFFIGTIYLILAMPYNLNVAVALGSSAIALILGICGLITRKTLVPPTPRELAWVLKDGEKFIPTMKGLIGSFSELSDDRGKIEKEKRYLLDIGYILLIIVIALLIGYVTII